MWTHKYDPGTIAVPADIPCDQFPGRDHYFINPGSGTVSVCHACAGHGTTKWARAYSLGHFFGNLAVAGALMAAEDRGYKSGYKTGHEHGYRRGVHNAPARDNY